MANTPIEKVSIMTSYLNSSSSANLLQASLSTDRQTEQLQYPRCTCMLRVMTSKPAHQTLSHNYQTKVCPLIPPYNCSGHYLTSNLTLQTTQIMCRPNPVRNGPVAPPRQRRSHGGCIYARWLLILVNLVIDVL